MGTLTKAFKSKAEQAFRILFVNFYAKYDEIVLVTEYPKSGGTWLGQLISSYLDIPFPRNTFPKFESCLIHGHYRPSSRFKYMKIVLWLVRDGRDVMVSLYHHYLLWNDKNSLNPKDILYHRSNLQYQDYEDINQNMPSFIEYVFEHVPPKWQQFTFMGNWKTFNEQWLSAYNEPSTNIFKVHYEDMLADTASIIEQIIKHGDNLSNVNKDKIYNVVKQFSFENQTKRNKGMESKKSFLRKGIAGDWKNYFTPEAAKKFDHYAGDVLVELGYEINRSWVVHFQNSYEGFTSS